MRRFLELKVSPSGLLHAVGVLAAGCTLAAFLADWHWLLELTCHFRLQYALALAAVALLTFLFRRRTPIAPDDPAVTLDPAPTLTLDPTLSPNLTPTPTPTLNPNLSLNPNLNLNLNPTLNPPPESKIKSRIKSKSGSASGSTDKPPRFGFTGQCGGDQAASHGARSGECLSPLRWFPFGPPDRWLPFVYGLLALTNLAVLSPYLFPQTGSAFAGTRRLRVVTLNVHTANPRHDLVEAFLRHEDPDVIVLTEVDDRWLTQLAPLTNRWPHSVPAPRDDNFGIALFSRHPLRDARAVYLGEAGVPSIEAEVRFESGSVVVVGTHPLPPSGAENSGLRDGQLDQVGEHLAGRSGPRILLGDLNTTPWSPVIRRLLTRSGLKDSLRGRGYQPTWPSHFFLFWIPLDHCLVSDEVAVLARHVGPHVGSDHRPVIVDLGLAGPP